MQSTHVRNFLKPPSPILHSTLCGPPPRGKFIPNHPILPVLSKSSHPQTDLRALHAHTITSGLLLDPFAASRIVQLFLKSDPSVARAIFHSLHHPDVYTWNAMIMAHPDAHSSVAHYFRMLQAGAPPNNYTFALLVKACVEGRSDILLAMKVHGQILKRGVEDLLVVRNSLITMYGNMGCLKEARVLFDLSSHLDLISWNSMISGYGKAGDAVSARDLFEEMPERSLVSWGAVIDGYVRKGGFLEALKLFNEMMVLGMKPDVVILVSVLKACAQLGALDQGRWIHIYVEKNRLGWEMNVVFSTALIDMYAKCGSLETAQQIFNSMSFRNLVTWNAMISGYARNGNLTSARELFDKMPERNVISWNSMIAGYAQNGHSATAIKLFKEMVMTKDLKPDEVTMVSVISACWHLGALELGTWVVKFIVENQIQLSISGYNSLIFMYSRCGSMEEAKKVFREMPLRDIVSYNSLIAGFAIHGHGHEALELLSRMKEEGVEPDRITFIGMLTACSHAGLSKQGRQIFESIEYPAVDHYSCMVDLLGRAGELDEAKRLVNSMPMKPHAGVYGALLNAARIHKHVELGELAANELFELEPENPGNYVLLSNIYASLGRWGDVERVWKLMQARGVKKTTACSWVEFNHKIHQFIAGDRSHERTKEIYEVLEKLGKRMRELGYIADKRCVLRDVEEEEKEEMIGTHSEKLAIGFGLLVSKAGEVIRVVKNLRVCGDCHIAIKMISKLTGREIVVRDNNRFHTFKDGECSCKDYW